MHHICGTITKQSFVNSFTVNGMDSRRGLEHRQGSGSLSFWRRGERGSENCIFLVVSNGMSDPNHCWILLVSWSLLIQSEERVVIVSTPKTCAFFPGPAKNGRQYLSWSSVTKHPKWPKMVCYLRPTKHAFSACVLFGSLLACAWQRSMDWTSQKTLNISQC